MNIESLSWNVSEEEYREYPALSYSLLSRYEKLGFAGLSKLFEPQESESLIFGSMVDTLITKSVDEFKEHYYIVNQMPSSTVSEIVKNILVTFNPDTLDDLTDEEIVSVAGDYQPNWKVETRAKKIREAGNAYYTVLKESQGKTIVDKDTMQTVTDTVTTLLNSPATKKYFDKDNNKDVCKYNQIKFKTKLHDIEYKCMFDLLIVDYKNKWILPVDLKTTSYPEFDFYKRYLDCRYDIQSRLYYRILNKCLENTEFKDFTIYNFQFVCINKILLQPLIWYDSYCKMTGDLSILTKTNKKINLRDPEVIGKELNYYLTFKSSVPNDIEINKPNNLVEWIKKM